MRAPPPVHIDVVGDPAWRAIQAALAAAAMVVPLAWAASWAAPMASGAVWGIPPWAATGLATFVGAFVGAWRWRRLREVQRPPRLRWDGQEWSLASPGASMLGGAPPESFRGDAALMIDLGGWMLVRLRDGNARTTWVALRHTDDAAGWCALRGALWNWHRQPSGTPR